IVGDRRYAAIALVGLPNSGKSTLLNALVGEKLAAVSQTPQTTRGKILGVVHRGDAQFAFFDTPGVHQAEHVLNQRMLHHIDLALDEADLILWVVDADGFLGPGERELAQRLKKARQPVYLVLNKLDLLSRSRLLSKIVEYKDLMAFKEIIPVGAKLGQNLDPLWALLERDAPKGAWAFDEDTFTDQTERAMASEFIREKVLRKTREEVPHGVAVLIRRWIEAGHEHFPGDLDPKGVYLEVEILVDRDNHRRILLGSGGAMIRDIRQSAQRELKKLLQRPVRLDLHVKVEQGWRDRPDKLDQMNL
ncbi:MAG: GTPase Era, partial [Firmicutes bacterium]|nr:GTPase Era [Bacillota bacterium]